MKTECRNIYCKNEARKGSSYCEGHGVTGRQPLKAPTQFSKAEVVLFTTIIGGYVSLLIASMGHVANFW